MRGLFIDCVCVLFVFIFPPSCICKGHSVVAEECRFLAVDCFAIDLWSLDLWEQPGEMKAAAISTFYVCNSRFEHSGVK